MLLAPSNIVVLSLILSSKVISADLLPSSDECKAYNLSSSVSLVLLQKPGNNSSSPHISVGVLEVRLGEPSSSSITTNLSELSFVYNKKKNQRQMQSSDFLSFHLKCLDEKSFLVTGRTGDMYEFSLPKLRVWSQIEQTDARRIIINPLSMGSPDTPF